LQDGKGGSRRFFDQKGNPSVAPQHQKAKVEKPKNTDGLSLKKGERERDPVKASIRNMGGNRFVWGEKKTHLSPETSTLGKKKDTSKEEGSLPYQKRRGPNEGGKMTKKKEGKDVRSTEGGKKILGGKEEFFL